MRKKKRGYEVVVDYISTFSEWKWKLFEYEVHAEWKALRDLKKEIETSLEKIYRETGVLSPENRLVIYQTIKEWFPFCTESIQWVMFEWLLERGKD